MHYLNTLYAGHFNFRYKRAGHVFQNRYHSIPVQTERYLLTLSRYIQLNAVVAGIVHKPEDYEWSSYREYIGKRVTGLLCPQLVLDTLSQNPVLQLQRYREFVEDKIGHKPEWDDATIWKTRVFGDDAFTTSIAKYCPASFAEQRTIGREISAKHHRWGMSPIIVNN